MIIEGDSIIHSIILSNFEIAQKFKCKQFPTKLKTSHIDGVCKFAICQLK